MGRPPLFVEGAVFVQGEGLKRFRTIEELIIHLYAPMGTSCGALEVRLAGIDPDGVPFNASLEFNGIEYGMVPGAGSNKAVRPPSTMGAEGPVPAAPGPATEQVVGPGAYPRRKRIGEFLVETGVITEAQLEAALAEQREGGGRERLGAILVRKGWIAPKLLYKILADQQKS